MKKRVVVFLKTLIVSIVSVVIAFLPLWWARSLVGVINSLVSRFSDASTLGYRIDFGVHFFLLGIAAFLQAVFFSFFYTGLPFFGRTGFYSISQKNGRTPIADIAKNNPLVFRRVFVILQRYGKK